MHAFTNSDEDRKQAQRSFLFYFFCYKLYHHLDLLVNFQNQQVMFHLIVSQICKDFPPMHYDNLQSSLIHCLDHAWELFIILEVCFRSHGVVYGVKIMFYKILKLFFV